MALHLLACPSCSRHVRVTEAACPFCGVTLSDSFRASPAPVAPRVRLARAALVALGAGAVAVTPACGAGTSLEGPGGKSDSGAVDAGTDAADAHMVVTVPYGLAPPPPEDAGHLSQPEAGPVDAASDAVVISPYGIVPLGDD